MLRYLLPLLLLSAPVVAQVPYSTPSPYGPIAGPQSFAPNYYNRSTQPVSPYLNLLNSTNPALSYYYGVRPGTQGPNGNGPMYGSGAQFPQVARGTFLPPAALSMPTRDPADGPQTSLPSPGGPVSYGNVFGSSRVGVSQQRGGFFGSGGGGGGTTPARPTTGGSGTPGSIPKVK